jgi:glycyl-tRNA synthetase
MFETQIGPSGDKKGYLRPETAQGQFLNFQKLYDFNNSRMPFASASIGKSFRNEISPRAGLLRVREFLMAEIEHFVDPRNKQHGRFKEVAKQVCAFLPRGVQDAGSTQTLKDTIGHAVETKMVDNETLGYFLVRIWQFLEKIGCDMTKVRFRQHMRNEMAHYASDCWDAEILTSYVTTSSHMWLTRKGWIECVGCADRSAFDLTMHSSATNTELVARKTLDEPIISEVWEAQLNRKKVGPKFKTDLKALETVLLAMSQDELEQASKALAEKGKIEFKLPGKEQLLVVDKEDLTIAKVTKKQTTYEYIPNVIEPSFGIGRILYSLMEHVFWQRAEDEQRAVAPPQ